MASGWGGPAVAVVVLWGLVSLACLPVLASSHVRAPIERWPTGRLGVNYVLLVGAVVLGHAATYLAGVVVRGGLGGSALVRWTMLVAGGYPLLVWLLVALVAPATGRWDPRGRGLDGRIALGLAAIWYAVVAVVAAAFVFLVLFALFFPG